MLKKVEAYALVKFAGDEKAAAEFVEGFTKAAMAVETPTRFQKALSFVKDMGTGRSNKDSLRGALMIGIGKTIGEGMGGMLINGAIGAVGTSIKQVGNNNLHTRFLEALASAISSNRIIKEANKDKVRQYAETVFKFAPNVATDTNLLSSILANAIHGEGIDPMTIKTLTELEGRYTDNTSFSPKTYI
jgi:hypothetical protein